MNSGKALYAPSFVKELLRRHGLHAQKSFGQNFLVDEHALLAVVDAAGITEDDTVLEVGPGLGVLTRELASRAGRVISVELDRRLFPVLEETLAGTDNVEIKEGDALAFDFSSLPGDSLLVANLPYNIATPLLIEALESLTFRRLVVMVQREVAERLVATPSTVAYGAVSIITRHFANARIVRNVSPASFYPAPEVTSSIVRLDVREGAQRRPELFELVKDAFRHRRKTLARNLQMAGYDRKSVESALLAQGLDPRVRGEALDLTHFEVLSERLEAGRA